MLIQETPFELIDCIDENDFLEKLSPIGPNFNRMKYPRSYIFRGQADSSWDLIPSALRCGIIKKLKSRGYYSEGSFKEENRTHINQICFEIEQIIKFFKEANHNQLIIPDDSQKLRKTLEDLDIKFSPNRERLKELLTHNKTIWPPREIWSLLAIAQHNGIPTRLLDWTWVSYIAAYFAAKSAINNNFDTGKISVWAFYVGPNYEYIQDSNIIHVVESPYATNINLAAQRGIQLLVTEKKVEFEDKIEPKFFHSALTDYCEQQMQEFSFKPLMKFTIPTERSKYLLHNLAKLGFSASSLFPGYPGIVEALREESQWEELS